MQRVKQHRPMARRQHEAVAIRPGRISRVNFQEAGKENRCNIGRPHGHAGMARFRGFDSIHRQSANRVRHALQFLARPSIAS